MELVKLGKVADFINGKAFKPSDWEDKGKKIIRIQNLNDCSKPYNRTSQNVEDKYLVYPNDILVSWSASLGVFEWKDSEIAVLNQHIFKVVPDEKLICKPYLKYALDKSIDLMLKYTHGSTMKHINRQEFLNIEIPLPPIASQRRIANILDKADEIIRKRKEAIALTEQLLKSTFLDMFGDPVINPKGWDVVTLEQVAEKEKGAIKCGPFGSQLLISEFQDIGIPVYGIDNVQKNEFIWAKPKFITREKYQQLRAFSIKLNDVLISRTGTVGRTCIAPPNIPESIIGANLLKVSLDQNEMSSKYLSYALSYSEFLIQEIKNMSPGATVPVFNTSNLKSLKLANPPMDLQIKFNLMINKIQEKIGKQKKSLQESENLFNSLLQKAFKGEL